MKTFHESTWLIFNCGAFIGTIIALTGFLNSNNEVSLKIAFCASIFILRSEVRHMGYKSTLRDNKNAAFQRIYFIKIWKKFVNTFEKNHLTKIDYDSIECGATELDIIKEIDIENINKRAEGMGDLMGDLNSEHLPPLNDRTGAYFLIEFLVCLGISMIIVKIFLHN